MSDDNLLTRLRSLGSPVSEPATDSEVREDVIRGRSSVRRTRYTRSVSVLGALAVAGVLGVTALNGAGSGPATGVDQASPSTGVTAGPEQDGLRLVAYTGTQPQGFQVATVPNGYTVVNSDPGALVIAPPGDKGTAKAEFSHRITVMLHSKDAGAPSSGTQVQVNGQPGTIWSTDDNDGTRVLSYTDNGHPVDIQVWGDIGLSDEQVVTLAEGITVTDDVIQGVG